MTPEIPTKEEAQKAVETLIRYIGDDATREGVKGTPERVLKSYEELFSGYNTNIEEILNKRFYDINGFGDLVLLRAINFHSVCEHHMLPFSGSVDIAYIPNGFVVGISKIARLVDAFARRLQIQEKMTVDIACAMQQCLNPIGVAVRVTATHTCMSVRGVSKEGSLMESIHYTGIFRDKPESRVEFMSLINK